MDFYALDLDLNLVLGIVISLMLPSACTVKLEIYMHKCHFCV
jgi:hypothetical protein